MHVCLIHAGPEPLPQTRVGPGELGFGKADRSTERPRDLLVGVPLHLEEPDHRTGRRRQTLQSPLDIEQLGVQRGGRQQRQFGAAVPARRIPRSVPSRARCQGDRRYIRHLETAIWRTHAPTGHSRRKLPQPRINRHHRLLKQVLGQSAIARQAPATERKRRGGHRGIKIRLRPRHSPAAARSEHIRGHIDLRESGHGSIRCISRLKGRNGRQL